MSVDDSWTRILAWCRANAPRNLEQIAPSSGAEAIAAVAAQFPNGWSDELRQWYALHDGIGFVDGGLWQTIVAEWEILPVSVLVEHAATLANLETGDLDLDEPDVAGEPVWQWHDSFVPIGSDGTGRVLFVDMRPGAARGCLTPFDPAQGEDEPLWPSIGAMLEELAAALASGGTFADSRAVVADGVLSWEYVGR